MKTKLQACLLALALVPWVSHAQLLEPVDLTWDSLKSEFNQRDAYPRIISVLSVNCLPCRLQRNDIRDQVMDPCGNPDLRWMIIWMEDPSHPAVRNDAVAQAALINDPRVTQYWFAEHQATTPKNDSIAYLIGSMPWIGCAYAYDFSLLYVPGVNWTTAMPAPDYCMGKGPACCSPYSVGNFKQQLIGLGYCNPTGTGTGEGEHSRGLRVYQEGEYLVFHITQDAAGPGMVRVYSLEGRKLKELEWGTYEKRHHGRIHAGELTTGVYIFEAKSGDRTLRKKIKIDRP